MNDIEIFGNIAKGNDFIKQTQNKKFLFSFVISYTHTCEIPGITVAGAHPELLKFTPAADAEFLHYGYCKSINAIPMTPDGKPTPAILTKVAIEASSIPCFVINAGTKIVPKLPYIELGLESGKNIALQPALESGHAGKAVEQGRIVGRSLGSSTDCLVIGESIPGGTTTALAVLRALGIKASVSSSMPQNPVELKNHVVEEALNRLHSTNPYDIVTQVGDPMIPTVAGMLSAASESTKVILAGGTQMAAVLAFAKHIGFNENNVAIGTTSYIIDDKTANLIETINQISDIPIFSIKLKLGESKISGLRAYGEGFVKEGVGAGGASISCILKTGIDSNRLLDLTEKEYQKIISQ
ncbi:MAG: nicotinate mononucleotide-dependent phosphoribosyltransferase CobT [Nitrosopumilaceae archaeon]